MTLSEFITASKDVIVGLSALFAVVFAYKGLTAWRKELKGTTEYRLAKEVLKSAYRVQRSINHVRVFVIFQDEYPIEMLDYNGNLKKEYYYEGTKYVYQKRCEVMTEAFNVLEEHFLDALVEFGIENQNVIEKLRSCKAEIIIAIDQKLAQLKNPSDYVQLNTEDQSILSYRGVNDKDNKFTLQINDSILEFDKWLKRYIKP